MLELVCHPNTPSRAARAVTAQVARTAEGKLSISYAIHGDIARLVIPAPGPARVGWKLWRHSCCELFVRQKGAAAYHEFNFSPSGEWATYAFAKYREGATLADEALNPQIALDSTGTQLNLYALVDLARLSSAYLRSPLAIGLAVIIEEESGNLSYWALRHAPGKPDFHHLQAFALELD